jgi:hypothetical protein
MPNELQTKKGSAHGVGAKCEPRNTGEGFQLKELLCAAASKRNKRISA